jgi:hypothetical protein
MILEYCAIAIALSITSVIVTGSVAIIIGIACVITGKDSD